MQRLIKLPVNVDNMCSIKYIDSTHLLITGEYSYDWPSIDKRDIGVLKYDTLFHLIRSKAFGKKDTEDFPGMKKILRSQMSIMFLLVVRTTWLDLNFQHRIHGTC